MMESPRKFNDCYFYYYSTCTKGDNCIFRHEPAALGCETMCTHWQQGKCLDQRCKFRHMELRKNRKQIPCYWENQPGGCRKKHCPFQHKNPEARTDGIAPSQPQSPQALQTGPQPAAPREPGEGPPIVLPHELIWQQQQRQDSAILGVLPAAGDILGHPVAGQRRVMAAAPHGLHEAPAPGAYAALPVDSLVVNFEEESDSESITNLTPTKNVSPEMTVARVVTSKTTELLQLERIQEEAAAYYSYDCDGILLSAEFQSKLRDNYESLSLDELSGRKPSLKNASKRTLDFKIMTLDEIRAKKKKLCHDKTEERSPMCSETNEKSLKRKISAIADIDEESLNECLKTISTNMGSKKPKRFKKSNKELRDSKPKLSRRKRVVVNKDEPVDSDNEIDEDVLLMDNDEGVEGFSNDDNEIMIDNEDVLLGEGKSGLNIPDVVASCNERLLSVYKSDDGNLDRGGRTINSIDAVYDKPL